MIRDKRIWHPDETCQPFLIENQVTNLNYKSMSFTVPSKHTAIIAYLVCDSDGTANGKANARVVITKGGKANPVGVNLEYGISTHGALLDVKELDATGNNIPGIAITPYSSGPRPCRIVLESGLYDVWMIASIGQVTNLSFSGWIFPNVNK